MRTIGAICGSAATVAILLVSGSARAQNSNSAAIVNGEAIPMSEIDAVMALRPRELFPVPQAQQRQARLEILDGLIAERLMRQFLAKNGEPVDPAEVEKQMKALTETQKSAGKSLVDYYKETRQTETHVRDSIKNMLEFSAYAKKKCSEEELKRYFTANIEYFQKVTVRCSHIVIRVPINATTAERKQARSKLAEIQQKLLARQITFSDAAREYSQCPTAPKGGDIGFIMRKWMGVDEAVTKTAFALKKGEMSDIVVSEYGLHLILVTDRTDPKPVDFAACIEEVRDCYTEELRQHLLADLRKKATIEITIK